MGADSGPRDPWLGGAMPKPVQERRPVTHTRSLTPAKPAAGSAPDPEQEVPVQIQWFPFSHRMEPSFKEWYRCYLGHFVLGTFYRIKTTLIISVRKGVG